MSDIRNSSQIYIVFYCALKADFNMYRQEVNVAAFVAIKMMSLNNSIV